VLVVVLKLICRTAYLIYHANGSHEEFAGQTITCLLVLQTSEDDGKKYVSLVYVPADCSNMVLKKPKDEPDDDESGANGMAGLTV
jgi:hypothetical protein